MNASLPKSVMGKMSQNFVNMSLPGNGSLSNPCNGFPACQIIIIILDAPITNFISNAKDSILKSIFVDMTICSTEVYSPYSTIAITDLDVKNINPPIQVTIPLLTALDTSNPNSTLGCGFIDPVDQIFK